MAELELEMQGLSLRKLASLISREADEELLSIDGSQDSTDHDDLSSSKSEGSTTSANPSYPSDSSTVSGNGQGW